MKKKRGRPPFKNPHQDFQLRFMKINNSRMFNVYLQHKKETIYKFQTSFENLKRFIKSRPFIFVPPAEKNEKALDSKHPNIRLNAIRRTRAQKS